MQALGEQAAQNYTPEQLAEINAITAQPINQGEITQGYAESDLKGNRGGYLYNKVLEGLGQVASGTGDILMQIAGKGDEFDFGQNPERQRGFTNEQIKQYREQTAPQIRGFLKETIGAPMDKRLENKYNNETVTSAFGGLASSMPAIAATVASAGVGTGAMAAQMFDNSIESINSSEVGRNLDEDTKTIFGAGVATVQTLLERYGLNKVLKSESGVLSDWIAKRALQQAIRQTDGKVTSDVFSKFLNKEVLNLSNKYLNGGIRALDGAVVEYGTEAAQEATAITGELLTNKATGQSVFSTKDINTWDGFVDNLKRINQSGMAGFIAGGGLGVMSGIVNLDRSKVEQTQTMLNEIDRNLSNENISEATRDALVGQKIRLQKEMDSYQKKIDSAYNSLSEQDKQKVSDIMERKLENQNIINDPNVTPEIKTELEKTNEELDKEAATIKPNEQVTFTYQTIDEVPDSLQSLAVEEDGKITVTLPKSDADALQSKIKSGDISDMELMDGRKEPIAKQPQIKAPTPEIEKQIKTEGIDYVYESNPNLSEIGTKEQYGEYLKTIFPESKLQDIVYRTSRDENALKAPSGILFFSGDRSYGEMMYPVSTAKTFAALLNLKNPKVLQGLDFMDVKDNPSSLEGYDGLVGDLRNLQRNPPPYSYIQEVTINDKNQEHVHILGSEKDLQGFKNFVDKGKETKSEDNENVPTKENVPSEITSSQEIKDGDIGKLAAKSIELLDKIREASGAARKRTLAEQRRSLLEQQPKLKYIDDNISDIYRQLKEKNIIETIGECP